jgi:hypothetical protein
MIRFERDDDNPGFCYGAVAGEGMVIYSSPAMPTVILAAER